MAEIFITRCNFCERKEFKSRKALLTHCKKRHPGEEVPPVCHFQNTAENPVRAPVPKKMRGSILKKRYKEWLSVDVECINSAHYPKAPGKWYHMDFPDVELIFFCHLLFMMNIAGPNSIKEAKHVKFPVWSSNVIRVSYKTTNLEDFVFALSEQTTVELCIKKAFKGMEEVHIDVLSQLRGRAALEAAKSGTVTTIPTKRSEITVEEGDGRATRECELIWWPLYNNTKRGKLTIRMYIAKVDI